jgi:hypothetical protein
MSADDLPQLVAQVILSLGDVPDGDDEVHGEDQDEPDAAVSTFQEGDLVTPFEVPDDASPIEGDSPAGGIQGGGVAGAGAKAGFTGQTSPGAEAIAVYRDIHRYRSDWGIYFFERPFRDFVRGTALEAKTTSLGAVRAGALRQLLFHEQTHCEVEVMASELEDVLHTHLYKSYVLRGRHTATQWTPEGILEEALATWREISFARRRWPTQIPKPPGFQRAAEAIARASPPGYKDWHKLEAFSTRRLVMAELAKLITRGQQITMDRWGRLEDREEAQIPRYWVGNPAMISVIGATPAGRPRPTPGFLGGRAPGPITEMLAEGPLR